MNFIIFKTHRHQYLYDRYSNAIICLNDEQAYEMKKVESGEIDGLQSQIIKNFQTNGILLEKEIEVIEHPEPPYLKHLLKNDMEQVTLQVTQNCNLRCEYCVYGGKYLNRKHCNNKMSFETAKAAIDFGISNSKETRRLSIGFYGGEPLLEFELIKKCILYVNQTVEGQDVFFTITTNGTLLSEDKMKFFCDYDVQIVISLDGMKEEHDKHRKFSNGQGSFDVIIKNVRKFKELYPDYVKRNVNFNTVISPETNVTKVEKYFNADDVLSDSYIMFNTMSEDGYQGEVEYNEMSLIKRRFEHLKMLLSLLGKVDVRSVSRIVVYGKSEIESLYRQLQFHTPIPRYMHHSGPCVPGVKRCFVSFDGKIYPCERVPELECTCIGDIYKGFDMGKVSNMLNIGKLSENECKNCWAIRLCMQCIKDIQLTEELPTKKEKLKACKQSKEDVIFNLTTIAILTELGYRLG